MGMKEGFADVRTINDRDEGRKRIMSHYSGTDEKKSGIEIIADEAVLKKMDDHRMLMEDVEEVIGFCEKSGKKAVNGETGDIYRPHAGGIHDLLGGIHACRRRKI